MEPKKSRRLDVYNWKGKPIISGENLSKEELRIVKQILRQYQIRWYIIRVIGFLTATGVLRLIFNI
jgi:hypothetical protein